VSVVRDEGGAAAGHYVVAFSDISAMRRAEAQLDHLTHHDPLTGLPNRLLFNDRLDQTLARAQREEGRCAILFFDLDGFKVINDTLGHSSGDLLLQTIAARLKRGLRSKADNRMSGGFRCHHGHCQDRGIQMLIRFLAIYESRLKEAAHG
jgi:hypothetical protein